MTSHVKCVLQTTALLLCVCVQSNARANIWDDFSNLEYDDKDPVSWIPGAFPDAILDASTGDLVVKHNQPSSTYIDMDYGDVVLRTRIRISEGNGRAGVFGRSPSSDSILGSIDTNGKVLIESAFDGTLTTRGTLDSDLDPTAQDVNLQLSLIGNQYGLTAWADNDEQPQPQLVWDDIGGEFPHTTGTTGIWQIPRDGTMATAYRFYEAVAVTLPGDFNGDGLLGVADIDLLSEAIALNLVFRIASEESNYGTH